MTRRILTAVALVAAGFLLAPAASAQGLQVGPPAELPPASFDGRQYVDSRGCVYVRAGVDGAVNWVPRVSQDRRLICGQTPSLSRPQTITAAAQPAPVIITPEPVVTAPVRTVRAQAAAPRQVGAQPRQIAQTHQTVQHRPQVREERIVPKHVYDSQGDTLIAVPKGYQPAWDDDRLNPHRAHMTRQGHAATQQVWSNTVPRRLLTKDQKIKEPVIVGRGKGLGH
ncbi:MAG: hypothetical protein ACSHXH_02325 [Marivita sp.]|uniref:hypothetical protein n=1 Tax=Marivita sp. TaxID=2003365 RepID=UPI003EF1819A